MEINPRMNGTCKICFSSGVDLASSLLEDALDEEVLSRLDYEDDIRLRVFFKDFLWFLKSKNRFKTKPSWFSFKKQWMNLLVWTIRELELGISFRALSD